MCIISGYGCYNLLDFYIRCVYDKRRHNDPVLLSSKLSSALFGISGKYSKLRYLIKNGIINYIHLTKEKIPENEVSHSKKWFFPANKRFLKISCGMSWGQTMITTLSWPGKP